MLEKNGLRPIRFHDLRHSCASLLLANGVPMKQIQEWLGHSDFSTRRHKREMTRNAIGRETGARVRLPDAPPNRMDR